MVVTPVGLSGITLLIVIAIVVWIRSRRSSQYYDSGKDKTKSRTPQGTPSDVSARLVSIGGTGTSPIEVPIYSGTNRIGRDRDLVNRVLPDENISRLHCRIVEKDNVFKIYDEGSLIGTYVNRQLVKHKPCDLHNGDRVELGPVMLRFELVTPEPEQPNSSDTSSSYTATGASEPTVNSDPNQTKPYAHPPSQSDDRP